MSECKTPWQRKWLALDVCAPAVQEMADQAASFCGRFFRNQPAPSLLVLTGLSGCGKTHVARAVHRWAIQAAFQALEAGGWDRASQVPAVMFLRWPDVPQALKQGLHGVVEDAIASDLLVIDDIGAENDPWKQAADALCRILSRRERKFTLITSNVSPAGWNERFDIRIADRLCRNSVIVDLSRVPSYAVR